MPLGKPSLTPPRGHPYDAGTSMTSDHDQPTQHGVLPVVLAAGLGTRMKSSKPKVLHELCGRPMLAYVLDAAGAVSDRRPLVVYSPHTAEIAEVFRHQADFALQATPRGTADALNSALIVAPKDTTEILVLSGDVPLVDPMLLAELIETRRQRGAAMALIAVATFEPDGLGRVVRSEDGGEVLRIVEDKDATPDELAIDEINGGIYAFDAAWLRSRIGDVKPSPVSGELYLPELVALARADRRAVISIEVEDDGQIGPVSHLRAKSSIGAKVKLGNFAEVKASRLEPGVQQHHFSYIGDAELGERTNVGAGTITCNYDGVRKHKTKIGKDVFLGSDTMLVAPVELGDGARTGAGSVVTKDVPAGMLAVGVPARIRKPRNSAVPPDDTAR